MCSSLRKTAWERWYECKRKYSTSQRIGISFGFMFSNGKNVNAVYFLCLFSQQKKNRRTTKQACRPEGAWAKEKLWATQAKMHKTNERRKQALVQGKLVRHIARCCSYMISDRMQNKRTHCYIRVQAYYFGFILSVGLVSLPVSSPVFPLLWHSAFSQPFYVCVCVCFSLYLYCGSTAIILRSYTR